MTVLLQNEINHIAGQIVSKTIERQGNALNETVAGNKILLDVAKRYVNCDPDKVQGRLFEVIETRKFNQAAAKAGSLLRAVTTESENNPHDKVDIFIKNGKGDILKEIQAKSGKNPQNLAHYLRREKYNGMDLLTNSDKKQQVEELMDKRISKGGIYAEQYSKAKNNLKSQLECGGIASGGTTYDEAMDATQNPRKYIVKSTCAEVISGAKSAMVGGALAGAFTGSIASSVTNLVSGEFSFEKTGRDTAKSAVQGAMVGGVAYGLKFIGRNNPIMKGNVVSALASSAVAVTELTYCYIQGKISLDEFIEKLGSNAVSCFTGIVMTAAGTALFGPIGGAIAGTVSLMAMRQLYDAFNIAREDLSLTRQARIQAEQFSKEIIVEIQEEERLLISYYNQYAEDIKELQGIVELAISDDQYTNDTIVRLAEKLNIQFEYDTRDKFRDFMLSDGTLEL